MTTTCLTPSLLRLVHIRANRQQAVFDKTGRYPSSGYFFYFRDVCIFNPFVDESYTSEVDPVDYYGDSFINSKFCRFSEDDARSVFELMKPRGACQRRVYASLLNLLNVGDLTFVQACYLADEAGIS